MGWLVRAMVVVRGCVEWRREVDGWGGGMMGVGWLRGLVGRWMCGGEVGRWDVGGWRLGGRGVVGGEGGRERLMLGELIWEEGRGNVWVAERGVGPTVVARPCVGLTGVVGSGLRRLCNAPVWRGVGGAGERRSTQCVIGWGQLIPTAASYLQTCWPVRQHIKVGERENTLAPGMLGAQAHLAGEIARCHSASPHGRSLRFWVSAKSIVDYSSMPGSAAAL